MMWLLAFLMGLGDIPAWAWEHISPLVYWIMNNPLIAGAGAGGFIALVAGLYYLKKSRAPLSEAVSKDEQELMAELADIQKKYEQEQ